MGSRIYLTNLTSDVSGYLLALVDMRNPNLPSAVATAVTTTTASGTNIQMTLTAGGTTAKWITRRLSQAITIGASTAQSVLVNWSASINQSYGNATLQLRLAKYTTSEQSAFLQDNNSLGVTGGRPSTGGSALGSVGPNMWSTTTASTNNSTFTSTAFAVGDRLVILPYITNAVNVTMGAGAQTTLNYDGLVNASGDSYIEVAPVLQVSQAQIGSASTPGVRGVSVGYFNQLITDLKGTNPSNAVDNSGVAISGTTQGFASDDTTVLALLNEAINQRGQV